MLYIITPEFSLGPLEVYSYESMADWTTKNSRPNYYWKDPNHPEGVGPFQTISTAVNHYKQVLLSYKGLTVLNKPLGVVIPVDFSKKTRLDR